MMKKCELCGMETTNHEKVGTLFVCSNCHEQWLELQAASSKQLKEAKTHYDEDIADVRRSCQQALQDFRREKARDKQDREEGNQ